MKRELGLAFSISATSRKPRGGELEGREYYFISPEKFREKINHHEFIEWEEVYPDQFYGTLRSEVERIWKAGEHALFDIDVVGGLNLKKEFGEKAISIFVKPPSLKVLEQRLKLRGTDDDEALKKRMGKARFELEYAPLFDHIIVNDSLDRTLEEAEKLVRNYLGN